MSVDSHDDSGLSHPVTTWLADLWDGWNRFWFSPRLPHVLAVIRICCGAMLAYIHVIWLVRMPDFLGENAWIDRAAIQELHRNDWAWSWLWYTDSPTLLIAHEVVAIVAAIFMMIGLGTRLAIPIIWFLTLMTCHRLTLAMFGLDQIVVMLSMYLMISRCGSVWSVDSILRRRDLDGEIYSPDPSLWLPASDAAVSNTIATRLIQLHLCVIYIFGGLSKMRGEMWFDGSAMWYTIVNYEYQSMDLTWLGRSRFAIASLTAMTIFWETFYCALVWPRMTRPIALMLAVFVHGGIAVGLGMVTFGFIMIVANGSFVEPDFLLRCLRSIKGEPATTNS